MMDKVILAGFGGQGVMFLGKLLLMLEWDQILSFAGFLLMVLR